MLTLVPSSLPPQTRGDPWLVRLLFNPSDMMEQIRYGEVTATLARTAIVPTGACATYGFPYGIRSQFLVYRIGSQEVARAHRYLLPNGRIGGSGRPDPQRIICCGGTLFC